MNRKQRLFVYLTGIFVAVLLVSDLIGGKFFRVAGLDFSVGMIPFPLTDNLHVREVQVKDPVPPEPAPDEPLPTS